jgi:protein-disulfide isomerase
MEPLGLAAAGGTAAGFLAVPVEPADHVRGSPTAEVTLVEYGHYQSGECAALQPFLAELLRVRSAQLRLVYRHFTLSASALHPLSMLAAEVAEAAAAQGRFWPVHDWLFSHQHELGRESLRRAELVFGLLPESVDLEVHSGLHRRRIERDHAGGVRSGVLHPPTIFVNGARIGAHRADDVMTELVRMVDRSLDVATPDRGAGT